MNWVYNDGGRQAAGYKGKAGDCVTRAVAIATGLPYQEVYDRLAEGMATQRVTKRSAKNTGRRSARSGITVKRKWFKDYMEGLGWRYVPTMKIGSGCTTHLQADELPKGRLIVQVSNHCTAVIDGVIHDTYDPNDRGATLYHSPPLARHEIPKNAVQLEGDSSIWVYDPKRCVYGYWMKQQEAA